MRLRLSELLGRLVGWRFGSQRHEQGRDQGREQAYEQARRAPDLAGRHRKGLPSDGMVPQTRPAPPLRPSAGLPRQDPPYQGPPRQGQPRPSLPRQDPRQVEPARRAPGGGVGRARIREAPYEAAPAVQSNPADAAMAPGLGQPREPWYQVVGRPQAGRGQASQLGLARAAQSKARPSPTVQPGQAGQPGQPGQPGQGRADIPRARPHPPSRRATADGRRSCGPLEKILWRQWDPATSIPPPPVIAAIDRLAEFPRALQEKLANGLDGIYIGDGGVPDLDHMAALHGVPLPSGRATWDACAGAYGDHKIVVGTRPSPTPDVMCHEVGHALDDLDSPPGKWQSDSAEFRLLYDQCQPHLVSDFHRQRGGLGRKEFFADAFAAIASAQRPALVDMLNGNTRVALRVMLYFNKRYGI
jgi:hypothetical protein